MLTLLVVIILGVALGAGLFWHFRTIAKTIVGGLCVLYVWAQTAEENRTMLVIGVIIVLLVASGIKQIVQERKEAGASRNPPPAHS